MMTGRPGQRWTLRTLTFAIDTDIRDQRATERNWGFYIPEQTWFGDRARCAVAAIPADLEFATRPAQVIAMITRCVQAGVEFRWFTADEEFGQNPGPRDYLEHAETAYVMAIPKNTEFTHTGGGTTEIKNWPERLSPNAWQRRCCGIGSKGYRVYDWAIIDTDRPDHQYMIRRSVDDGELAFHHCYNPRHEPAGKLVRVAGTRWPIEECIQTGKGDVGLDNYQVRLYHAWYRHITLTMIAQSFLAVLAHRHHAKKGDSHPRAATPHRPPPPPGNPPTTRPLTTRPPTPTRSQRPRRRSGAGSA